MSCPEWEEPVALLAGGELAGGEAAAVEGHLAMCAGCRRLADELRGDRQSLSALPWGAPEEAALERVRRGVLGRLRARGSRIWYAAAAILTLAVAAGLLWRIVGQEAPPPPVPVAAVGAPSVLAVPRSAGPPVAGAQPRRPARRQSHAGLRQPSEPLVVKLLTDDPNVVIYWLSDTNGGME